MEAHEQHVDVQPELDMERTTRLTADPLLDHAALDQFAH